MPPEIKVRFRQNPVGGGVAMAARRKHCTCNLVRYWNVHKVENADNRRGEFRLHLTVHPVAPDDLARAPTLAP